MGTDHEVCFCRGGSNEEYTEKMKLLQEMFDLKEAGKIVVQQKKEEKRKADKEAKKKISIRKAGEDIRVKAMQTLAEGKLEISIVQSIVHAQ